MFARTIGASIHYLTRRGRMRPFVLSLILALLVLPPIEALAYFAASGTGTIAGAQAGAPSSVVTITGGAFTYSNGTNLMPGGTVSFPVNAQCTASCPAFVANINLNTWSSNKVGCDTSTMPGSFTMPALVVNQSIGASATAVGTATITWVNLAINQNACSGAIFTFTLVTP